MRKQENFCSRSGAERLAHNIERYWAGRGRFITCRVEPVPGSISSWQVRSDINLVMPMGLPK
jgi:hypothetical protein